MVSNPKQGAAVVVRYKKKLKGWFPLEGKRGIVTIVCKARRCRNHGNTGIRSPWRERSREVIRQVLSANPDTDEPELRKLISDAYPFGQRENHPYKIWCSEVRNQLNLRKAKPICTTGNNKPSSEGDYNDTPLFQEPS